MPGWVQTNVFFSSGAAFLSLAPSSAKGYYATAGKSLKLDGYRPIQRGVLQALNPLSNRVTFTIHATYIDIVLRAYLGEPKCGKMLKTAIFPAGRACITHYYWVES